MFIRRGFYKLRFEVEIEDKNQEVNMEDANNDVDGENGENQGGGKNGDAHDVDMDHRGNDKEEASKENSHDGSTTHNGVAGMQEQCGIVEAVRVGTMEINLSSPDSLETAAASGSVRAGLVVSSQSPAIGQMLSAAALAPQAANGEVMCADEPLLSANQRGWAPVASSQAGDRRADVAAVSTENACGGKAPDRSSAPREGRSPVAAVKLSPQKIRHAEAGRPVLSTPVTQVLQPMMGCSPGSPVHCRGVASDGFLEPGLISSLKRVNGSSSDKISIAKNGDSSIMGVRKPVGVVSSLMSKDRPTEEEVIAFGGIPKSSLEARTSARLGGQLGVDMTQMEKAMRNAQLRDASSCAGYPYGVTLGPVVGSSVTGGTAGCYGYWMHTAPDGRSGYLVPGWLASQ